MGVAGAVMTLVGFVIGISIFILPGTLAATAAPAVVVSYALAAIMALFSCIVAAQIGSVFPVSGASFVAVSRVLSPLWGFVTVWLIFGGASVAIALLAYGFADYFILLVPEVDRFVAALGLVLVLGGLNLLGIKKTVTVQALMVILFMLALVVFIVAGLTQLDADLLSPFMANGITPVLAAVVPAYFSFAGFNLIIEIGGEIKHPQSAIPRALAISFLTVLIVYMAVSLVIVGLIPWTDLGDLGAPVGEAAKIVLPEWIAKAISMTILAAAATSINAMLLGYSRDVLALARFGILPPSFGKISAKHGEPVYGVVSMVVLAVIAVISGASITQYATVVVFGVLLVQIALGLAAIKLPQKVSSEFAQSQFQLSRGSLAFFSMGLILLSAALLILAIVTSPGASTIAGLYLLAGFGCYYARRQTLCAIH